MKTQHILLLIFSLTTTISGIAQSVLKVGSPDATFNSVNDAGQFVGGQMLFDFETDETTIFDDPVLINITDINNAGDMCAELLHSSEVALEAGYRLTGESDWTGIGYFTEDYQPTSGDFVRAAGISENGRYITGRTSFITDSTGFASFMYRYDIQEDTLINLHQAPWEGSSGNSVIDDGRVFGFVDDPEIGTIRMPAHTNEQDSILLLPLGVSYDSLINSLDEIADCSPNGRYLVGSASALPFVYDLETDSFQIFQVPEPYDFGSFFSVSNDGVCVGTMQIFNPNIIEREAIIYHPSFGAEVVRLADIIEEDGILLSDFPEVFLDQRMGVANGISANGNYIVGFSNSTRNGAFFSAWALRLGDMITSTQEKVLVEQTSVYPNPSRAFINLDIPEERLRNTIFNIRDINGKHFMTTQGTKQINTNTLPSGMYFIDIVEEKTQKTVEVLKFTKQ